MDKYLMLLIDNNKTDNKYVLIKLLIGLVNMI